MTEQEWLQATDPEPMLEFLRAKVSERKLRLFAVACCQRNWHLLDTGYRYLVELAERAADSAERYPTPNLASARSDAEAAVLCSFFPDADSVAHRVACLASGVVWPEAAIEGTFSDYAPRTLMERRIQAYMLRCIIGNPFRPITLDPSWLTWHDGLLVSMAQQMYDSRDFTDLPILADALEEAGCQDQGILGHCRSGCEHVKGCWVLDLVLLNDNRNVRS